MRLVVMMAAAGMLATAPAGAMTADQENAVKSAAWYLMLARECARDLNDNTLFAEAQENSKTLLFRAGFTEDEATDYVERMSAAPEGDPVPLGETFCRSAIEAARSQF